jgi:hypothetical protein
LMSRKHREPTFKRRQRVLLSAEVVVRLWP